MDNSRNGKARNERFEYAQRYFTACHYEAGPSKTDQSGFFSMSLLLRFRESSLEDFVQYTVVDEEEGNEMIASPFHKKLIRGSRGRS